MLARSWQRCTQDFHTPGRLSHEYSSPATDFELSGEVFADISRVQDLLKALAQFGGTFLYGESNHGRCFLCLLCIACVLMLRLRTAVADYSARLLAHPWLLEWEALSRDEPPIKKYDQLLHP